MALTLRRCLFQLLLYHTGEGNEARRARQPKVIDLRVGPDGETRAQRSRLEADFPDIVACEEMLHLCQGFLNHSVRCVVLVRTLHTRLYGLLLLMFATVQTDYSMRRVHHFGQL